MKRFLSKTKKELNGCWTWTASKSGSAGYGGFYFKGTKHYAHRVSWELHNGKIPNGMYVLHKCDNPSCVNPSHLFLGTQSDNINDSYAKGRHPSGVGKRSLSLNRVEEIRERLKNGESQTSIGTDLSVNVQVIWQVAQGITYKNI